MSDVNKEIDGFLAAWGDDSNGCKGVFQELYRFLAGMKDTVLEFHARPGVTYSLRGAHKSQKERPLFVMIDVIDDNPKWVSVCFYGEMVTDPDQTSDIVPGGLLGEDGMCFDLDDGGSNMTAYVKARIQEAFQYVGGEA